ncbi:hypothetical protein RQP46_011014 [Phenoliferia psychrophenolica]
MLAFRTPDATALVALLVCAASCAAQRQINLPNTFTACVPANISWSGAISPFTLTVVGATSTNELKTAPTLKTLATNITDAFFSWDVNLAAATSIAIKLVDGAGTASFSAINVVLAGKTSAW